MALACPRFTSGILLTWTLSHCWDKRHMRVPLFQSLVPRRDKDGARQGEQTEWSYWQEDKGQWRSFKCREQESVTSPFGAEKLRKNSTPIHFHETKLFKTTAPFTSMFPSLRPCHQALLLLSEQQLVWVVKVSYPSKVVWGFYLWGFFGLFLSELWQATHRLVKGMRGGIIFSCSSDRRRMKLCHSIHKTPLSWPRLLPHSSAS